MQDQQVFLVYRHGFTTTTTTATTISSVGGKSSSISSLAVFVCVGAFGGGSQWMAKR